MLILMGCCGSSFERKLSGSITPNNKVAADDLVTADMLEDWKRKFDYVMATQIGQAHLAEFLKQEYSDENILFWQACEELKKEKNSEKTEEKARIIYEDFISILSPKEVSLDSRVREIVNTNMTKPNIHTFDDAQDQIYNLMARDSYPRFLTSNVYKQACIRVNGYVEEPV